MPRASRYSEATKRLSAELAALGYRVSCSSLESWSRDGLAPPPIRVSRGRKGSTSYYPTGAVEQYASVASVMKPGRDRRAATLILISKGGLPTTEEMFRRAMRCLFEDMVLEGFDPLARAEEMFSGSATDRDFARIAGVFRNNAERVNLKDPVTGQVLSPEAVTEGATVNAMAAMWGRQPSSEALSEMATAYGLFAPGVSPDERETILRYLDAAYDEVLNLAALHETAMRVTPGRLQAAV